MASKSQFESLDEEITELLQNFKFKKATVYEPCTTKNIKECLIGLTEELELINVNFVFNPYLDITMEQTLNQKALVNLINGIWTLLHYHKTTAEKAEKLVEENHLLQYQKQQLIYKVQELAENLSHVQHEVQTCKGAAHKVSMNTDALIHSLGETQAKLVQVKKQKETTEKSLRHEITRLKNENEKLSDRLRSKSVPARIPRKPITPLSPPSRSSVLGMNSPVSGLCQIANEYSDVTDLHFDQPGASTPCSVVCGSTVQQLREKDRKQQALISKLQRNVQDLVKEVLEMKEKIILHGIQ